jgi:hypothetical protein
MKKEYENLDLISLFEVGAGENFIALERKQGLNN